MEEEDEGRDLWEKVGAVFKLCIIVACYAAAFLSLVQLGYWLINEPTFGPIILPTPFITWMEEKWRHGVWWEMVTKAILTNTGLLLIFGAQHSLMSQRNLENTSIWMSLHYIHKIDRPLYVLATGAALQGIFRLWQHVPVVMWSLPIVKDYYAIVHIICWIALYGTSLMLDLPDLVGFNQVVVSSPTMTRKSPDLQLMYRSQRHMGFIPFMLILLVHPLMTLDRFLLTFATALYTFGCWRSTGSYEYACEMKQRKL